MQSKSMYYSASILISISCLNAKPSIIPDNAKIQAYKTFYKEIFPCLKQFCDEICDLTKMETFLKGSVDCKTCARKECSDYIMEKQANKVQATESSQVESNSPADEIEERKDEKTDYENDYETEDEENYNDNEVDETEYEDEIENSQLDFSEYDQAAAVEQSKEDGEEIEDYDDEKEYTNENYEEDEPIMEPYLTRSAKMAICLKNNCIRICPVGPKMLEHEKCFDCMAENCESFIEWREIDEDDSRKEEPERSGLNDDTIQQTDEEERPSQNNFINNKKNDNSNKNKNNKQKTNDKNNYVAAEMCSKSFCYNQCKNEENRSLVACKACVVEVCNKTCLLEKCNEDCGPFAKNLNDCMDCSQKCPTKIEKKKMDLERQEKKQKILEDKKKQKELRKQKIDNIKADKMRLEQETIEADLRRQELEDKMEEKERIMATPIPSVKIHTVRPSFSPVSKPTKISGEHLVPDCARSCAMICNQPTEFCAVCIHEMCKGSSQENLKILYENFAHDTLPCCFYPHPP